MQGALKIIVTGRVQGVGFRPFIYSLAKKFELTGTVQNNLNGVIITIEGKEAHLYKVVEELKLSPPRLAKIKTITTHDVKSNGYKDFSIIPSQKEGENIPWIPADAAICDQCLIEMFDLHNRRYQYPFINCTQCGPRYTIIEELPYDRPYTTMKEFTMCPDCLEEYEDPSNRRHHAQPISCWSCGPSLSLLTKKGERLSENNGAIAQTKALLKSGSIIAIKGVGGYHLACDPQQITVVNKLRERKRRPQRPLAIMVKSLDVAKRFCHVSPTEEKLLFSSEMPIVILSRKRNYPLSEHLSPGLSTLGVMLPYTPLHHLLLDDGLPYLVMTSANQSGLPIQFQDETLIEKMHPVADYLLTHNRKINQPIDDSVIHCDGNKVIHVRRGRGFAPEPIKTMNNVDQIIALGGNQKNTFAIGKKNHIYLSPHIGDLDSEEMITFLEEQLDHYKSALKVKEKYVVIDKHPFYATSQIIKKLPGHSIAVQHHHAHHVSCMEDNGLEQPCFGIILDGTGYGDDGHIWGFEFLYGNAFSFERLGHLMYTPLPGGEKSVKEPWRNAIAMLLQFWGDKGYLLALELFPEKVKEVKMIKQIIEHKINSPMAGTCGRLFDAISAILGVCETSTYEGEAAITLADYMQLANVVDFHEEPYPYMIHSKKGKSLLLDFSLMINEIIKDRLQGQPIEKIIRKFHQTIVLSCVEMMTTVVNNRPNYNRNVVLSGGSFQNVYLLRELQNKLRSEGFTVYTHQKVPCNDGGLAVGQMIIASHVINKGVDMDERR